MTDRIITLAQSRGSTATTHSGALRWLRTHLPAPIPGLIRTDAAARHMIQYDRPLDGGMTRNWSLNWSAQPRRMTRAQWIKARMIRLGGARCDALGLERRDAYERRMADIAVKVGTAYHARIESLYQSQYGYVGAGRATEIVDHDRYAKSYGHPGKNKIAGAWYERPALWAKWVNISDPAQYTERIALETTRGRIIYLPIPPAGAAFDHPALMHGDLYAMPYGRGDKTVARNAPDGSRTGIASRLPSPWDRNNSTYWEHGATREEIQREHAGKLALLAARVDQDAAAAAMENTNRARAAMDEADRRREERRDRLLARISKTVQVSRDDARAIGACQAGIQAWCQRVGIGADVNTLPAREIVKLGEATHERRAIAAALVAVRRAIAAHR